MSNSAADAMGKCPIIGSRTGGKLVLDDILNAIVQMRSQCQLADKDLHYTLDLEGHAGKTRRRLIDKIVATKDEGIFTTDHPLLAGLGPRVLGEWFLSEFAPRLRLSPGVVPDALRLVFDLSLQTIVQLAPRDEQLNPRRFRALGASLSKLSDSLRDGFEKHHMFRYIGPELETRIRQLADEMAYVGRAISSRPSRRQYIVRIDSPNPQIRFATYLAGWVKAGSAQQHYEDLQELIGAAFLATGKRPPAWTDRLGLEMHRKLNYRKEWGKRVDGFTH